SSDLRGRVLLFSREPAHREKGQRAVFTRAGRVILASDESETELLSVERIPMTHGGRVTFQVENALAAAGAAWALGLPLESIREGLASFRCDAVQAPGRFNVLEKN